MEIEDKEIRVHVEYKENPTFKGVLDSLIDTGKYRAITKIVDTGNGIEYHKKNIKIRKDTRKYIKIFQDAESLKRMLLLTTTAQRVLHFILNKMDTHGLSIYIFSNQFTKELDISRQSLSTGLKELLDNGWIFKSDVKKMYWINLYYMCKGSMEDVYYRKERSTPL